MSDEQSPNFDGIQDDKIGRMPLPVDLLIFPLYRPGRKTRLESLSGARAAMDLARHSFNFLELGLQGFDAVAGMARRARVYRLVYSDINAALEQISRIFA